MWTHLVCVSALLSAQAATPVPRTNVVVPRPADLPYLTELVVKPVTDETVLEPPRRFGERPFVVTAVLEASDTGARAGFDDLLLFSGEREQRRVEVGGHEVLVTVGIDASGSRAVIDVAPVQPGRTSPRLVGQHLAVWLPGNGVDEPAAGPGPAVTRPR